MYTTSFCICKRKTKIDRQKYSKKLLILHSLEDLLMLSLTLVPNADKTTITTTSLINDSNDTYNLYISFGNLLMFKLCSHCNNCDTAFTLQESILTAKSLIWCYYCFNPGRKFLWIGCLWYKLLYIAHHLQ